jgi:hypothetical protein
VSRLTALTQFASQHSIIGTCTKSIGAGIAHGDKHNAHHDVQLPKPDTQQDCHAEISDRKVSAGPTLKVRTSFTDSAPSPLQASSACSGACTAMSEI